MTDVPAWKHIPMEFGCDEENCSPESVPSHWTRNRTPVVPDRDALAEVLEARAEAAAAGVRMAAAWAAFWQAVDRLESANRQAAGAHDG